MAQCAHVPKSANFSSEFTLAQMVLRSDLKILFPWQKFPKEKLF